MVSMEIATESKNVNRQSVIVIAMLAFVWIAAAALRSETTFHLGPVLLPVAQLVVADHASDLRPLVLFGVVTGAGVIGLLAAVGLLDGPALGRFTSAAAESVVVLLVAGAVGLLLAFVADRRVGNRV